MTDHTMPCSAVTCHDMELDWPGIPAWPAHLMENTEEGGEEGGGPQQLPGAPRVGAGGLGCQIGAPEQSSGPHVEKAA